MARRRRPKLTGGAGQLLLKVPAAPVERLPGIGVDTDADGGIVVLSPDARSVLATFTAPTRNGEWHQVDANALVEALRAAVAPYESAHVFIEKDQPIRDGNNVRTKMSGTMALSRMVGRYQVQLYTIAATMTLMEVAAWQRTQGIDKRGFYRLRHADTKGASLAAARDLWPEIDLCPGRRRTPQHGVSDAALIARHGLKSLLFRAV